MRRIGLVLGLAMLLPACGLSAARVEGAQDSAVSPPTTAQAVPSTSEALAPSTTSAAPATSPAAPPTTTESPPPQPAGTMVVAPYFLVDELGRPTRTGPFLIPVAREVEQNKAVARRAIEQLLAGPSEEERAAIPSISSAIPEHVRLLGLTIENGTATVDFSSGFALGEDAAAVAQRVAQVVFTLTRFDTVDRVEFLEDGMEAAVPTSDGRLVSAAVSTGDYLDFAAAISVEGPLYGDIVSDPLRVTGFAAVFEASFRYALTDANGLIIEEGVAMTTNGMGWGDFDFTIDYDVDREQVGSLVVWAHSAQDGSRIDVRDYPVRLTP
jgi:hypothetical protein